MFPVLDFYCSIWCKFTINKFSWLTNYFVKSSSPLKKGYNFIFFQRFWDYRLFLKQNQFVIFNTNVIDHILTNILSPSLRKSDYWFKSYDVLKFASSFLFLLYLEITQKWPNDVAWEFPMRRPEYHKTAYFQTRNVIFWKLL